MKPLVCPGCRKKMSPLSDGGVTLDACTECNGLWLDKGELEARGAKLPAGGIEYRGDRRCPRCDYKLMVRPSKVVQVDFCPDCGGVYLDHGELAMLVRVARVAQGPEPAAQEREKPRPPPRKAQKPAADVEKRVAAIQPTGAPAVPAAKRASREAAGPSEPRFVCDSCKAQRLLRDQVIGAKQTVCRACAKERGITADPEARRQHEQRARSDDAVAEQFWSEMLFGEKDRDRKPAPEIVDLLARLLR